MTPSARWRVFLTGATGTVGGGVFEALMDTDRFDVTCLVRHAAQAARLEQRGARTAVGDMTDETLFAQIRSDMEFEFIIHAAQASYTRYPQEAIDRLERIAARQLERLATPATHLMLFTGGVWSYGTGAQGGLISETTPLAPFTAAAARVELVSELLNQTPSLWAVVDPPSMVYGDAGPVADLIRAFRDGATVEVLDDDRVLWSLVERHDLGRAYVALLDHARPGETFLVAEPAAVSVPQFYTEIARAVGKGRVVRKKLSHFAGVDAAELERRRTSQPVDATRLRNRTGWSPRTDFETNIPAMVRTSIRA